jgi:hypothetical protein
MRNYLDRLVKKDYENQWIFHLIFYRIPKNASTSMITHLGSFNLIKKHEQRFHEIADKKIYRNWFDPTHAKPNEALKVFKNELRNYFSFCIVRNPWDRAISMYHFATKENLFSLYNLKKDINFENFCHLLNERKNDYSFIATHKQVEWTTGVYPPKVILRFENLQEEFRGMLNKYEIRHISPNIPHENSTKHSHYKDYYNPETKKIIANVFEEDIDTFKYIY